MATAFKFAGAKICCLLWLCCMLHTEKLIAQLSPEVCSNYWSSNPSIHNKAARSILKSHIAFDTVQTFLEEGRPYDANVKKGFLNWDRKTPAGIHLFALIFIPYNYTPQKKWPVRVVLHGDISHKDPYNVFRFIDTTLDAYKNLEEIRIYPSGYFAARWYYKIQYENVTQLLDSVKQLYNVDENRVALGGFSDGGTGTYAFINYDVTPYNVFLPSIGSCGSLKVLGVKEVYLNNYRNKPIFIENGKLDETFPYQIVLPYVNQLQLLNDSVTFLLIDTCGHTLRWMPQYKDTIDHFIASHPRYPNPRHLIWQTESTSVFNRNHWVLINGIGNSDSNAPGLIDYNQVYAEGQYRQAFRRDSIFGIIEVQATGNTITVQTKNVTAYTLLLSPDLFDFSKPFQIITNNKISFNGLIDKKVATLLRWNGIDHDRTMLYAAEMKIVPGKVY